MLKKLNIIKWDIEKIVERSNVYYILYVFFENHVECEILTNSNKENVYGFLLDVLKKNGCYETDEGKLYVII